MPDEPGETSRPVGDALADSIGRRVKDARTQAGLSMRALAELCDVSQPFVSQMERGRAVPSLSTLYRVAAALQIPVNSLLPEAVSAPEILALDAGSGRTMPVSEEPGSAAGRLLTIGGDHPLEVVEYRVSPGESLGTWFTGDGEQTLYVITGQVRVELADEGVWVLDAGGSLTHPASIPHRWSAGSSGCHLLLAVAHTTDRPTSAVPRRRQR